jgi:hypothetical protein
MPALQHLDTLERVTGSSGEFDVLVHAPDVTRGSVVTWMRGYERRASDHFGYSAAHGCGHATLCPALSLPTLLQTADGTLSAVPAYFQRAVLTPDHRYAVLAFGIRLMPLSEQRQVIAYMRSALNPPRGMSAALTGLPVLAADADGSLSSSSRRLLMLLVGLSATEHRPAGTTRSASPQSRPQATSNPTEASFTGVEPVLCRSTSICGSGSTRKGAAGRDNRRFWTFG